jgi:hypothetical protein
MSAKPDAHPQQGEPTQTIDDVPSCGQKNDYHRARPQQAAAPGAEPVTQIEERFPNWRSYRDLIDCIDRTLTISAIAS